MYKRKNETKLVKSGPAEEINAAKWICWSSGVIKTAKELISYSKATLPPSCKFVLLLSLDCAYVFQICNSLA